MFFLLGTRGEIVRLEDDEHAHAGSAEEDGAGERFVLGVGDGRGELYEADAGAPAVDGLEGYGS